MASSAVTYKLPQGAVFALKQILPTSAWYAEQQTNHAKLVVHGVAAEEALPEVTPPERQPGMTDQQFAAAVREWSLIPIEVSWTDQQKTAVKACVKYYLSKGHLLATPAVAQMIVTLGLADD